MATNIFIKRSSVKGKAPTTSDLAAGELALNMRDAKLFAANSSAVFEIGSNVSSSSIGSLTIGNSSPYTLPTSDGSPGQVLTTDGSGTVTFSAPSGGTLASLTDVAQVTPTDGHVLKYASANTTYYFAAESGGGGALADLSDVAQVTPSDGQILKYSSANTTYYFSDVGATYYDNFTFTSNTGQTEFNGTDDNGKTLNYSLNTTDVYLNGVKQVKGVDWFANTASQITLSVGTADDDVLDVVTFTGISIQSQYLEVANSTQYLQVSNAVGIFANSNDGIFTGNTNFNNATLYVDAVNDRVGVGTATPTDGNLHVKGSAYNEQLTIERTDTTSKWGLAGIDSGGFQIYDVNGGDATRMVIDSGGNVGIGTDTLTSTSGYKTLSISGSTGAQLAFQTGGVGKQYIFSTSTDLDIYNAQAGNIKFTTNAIERMRINSNGDVGIGTTSLNSYAGWKTTTFGSGATGVELDLLLSDNSTAGALYAYSTAVGLQSTAGSNLPVVIRTNSVERMNIDTSGRIVTAYQPAFVATKSNSNYTGGGDITSWNSVPLNVGSSFNGTTGVFTAPVAGKYFFSGRVLLNNNNSAGYYYLDFEYNGAATSRNYKYVPANTYESFDTTVLYNLNANDTVNLAAQPSGSWYGVSSVYTQFMGRLLG